MSGPDETWAAGLPLPMDMQLQTEQFLLRKPGKQLSASLPLSKRENIHTEICGKG